MQSMGSQSWTRLSYWIALNWSNQSKVQERSCNPKKGLFLFPGTESRSWPSQTPMQRNHLRDEKWALMAEYLCQTCLSESILQPDWERSVLSFVLSTAKILFINQLFSVKHFFITAFVIGKYGCVCRSVQSVQSLKSCLTLYDSMDCSTSGLPVHHQLLELAPTHAHWVGDVIQPAHPLSSPSPPAFNLSQHQGLF